MDNIEREKYLKAYYDNEADANKQMSFANAAAGIYMLAIWIFYLTGFFKIHSDITLILINVIFPVSVLILFSPLLYVFVFKDKLRKPNYKYFVIFTFVLVIAALNTILPKHSAIAWALCIIMTNHYYNPKVGLVVFIAVIVASLFCMYGGMFVGEFDANLLFGNDVLELENAQALYADGPKGRYEMLHKLIEMGYNRYFESLIYYFLPRAVILLLVFFVSNALNRRTYKLLVNEIHVNSEQEKTKTELEVAKEIQLNTLPNEITTSEDVEIVGELRAAKEVGGDFYDYINIDDNHVAILIGDVSGKGIPAAMFMMKTITCFKNFTRVDKKPSEILKEVNKAIYENNYSQMFVTCFIAILDRRDGRLVYSNAGHNPPIVGSNQDFRYLKCNSGFVLGGLPDAFVKDEEIFLKSGESFTLYTDGVTEARNKKGEFFGEDRLLQTFNKKDYTCLVELHHTLKDDVNIFVGDAPQNDDITIVTIKYHGDHYSYEEKIFNALPENIPSMLEFVEGFCSKQKIKPEFTANLSIVGDELFSNIVKYGYENKGGDLYVRLLYNHDKNEFVFTIIDRAPAFNQLEVNNAPIEGNADDQQVGGLGILIVKKIMTKYAYDRINGKNILVLRKKF